MGALPIQLAIIMADLLHDGHATSKDGEVREKVQLLQLYD